MTPLGEGATGSPDGCVGGGGFVCWPIPRSFWVQSRQVLQTPVTLLHSSTLRVRHFVIHATRASRATSCDSVLPLVALCFRLASNVWSRSCSSSCRAWADLVFSFTSSCFWVSSDSSRCWRVRRRVRVRVRNSRRARRFARWQGFGPHSVLMPPESGGPCWCWRGPVAKIGKLKLAHQLLHHRLHYQKNVFVYFM